MVSRRTRVASWIFRRDHPSRPKVMICSFFSSFKTFAMLREATYPPAAVNVLDDSSESMAAFQVFLYGRFWVFTEDEQVYRFNNRQKPMDDYARFEKVLGQLAHKRLTYAELTGKTDEAKTTTPEPF